VFKKLLRDQHIAHYKTKLGKKVKFLPLPYKVRSSKAIFKVNT